MELLEVEEIIEVALFTIKLSEDELKIFADSLSYILKNLDTANLYNVFTDDEYRVPGNAEQMREFVQENLRQIMLLLKNNCNQEFLPKRFKEWEDVENNDE
jgi:hypothetical protein